MSWKSSRARVVKSSRSSGPPAVSQARAALTTRRVSVAVVSFTAFILAVGLALGGAASATPSSPTDETKVPHYFGPYPNWANSPLASPDATVTITGDVVGGGATATAQVGAKGAITGLTLTDPGSGYTSATVEITGAGTGATATADVQTSGAVTAINVGAEGSGYTKPSVTISGGGATTDATAHVLGGVDAVTLSEFGSGYTFPTVDFDLPDDPGGVQASGHVTCVETDCKPANAGDTVTITGLAIDNAGSGYFSAPNVVIRDGTQFDPINHDPATFTEAKGTATLKIQSVVLDLIGVTRHLCWVADSGLPGTVAP